MAARSIASLSLGFGLVSIPVKLYSATESAETIRFNLLAKDGSRVKQQYVSEKDMKTVVPRSDMIRGFEFERDQYVLFQPDELKALEEGTSHTIDIVSFIPEKAVDPIYYDKAYYLAPDKRGGKPYNLLLAAMEESGRCALAKWAWKGKQYVVQVRAAEGGLVLQQLLYAKEVRSMKDLGIEREAPSQAELKLALQLIEQIAEPDYDPNEFVDEEHNRIMAAIEAKIAGKEIVAVAPTGEPTTGEVIDLTAALLASLKKQPVRSKEAAPAAAAPVAAAEGENVTTLATKDRKSPKRVAKASQEAPAAARATRK